jgi:uncharacterized membrane protein YeaQ/YmgE (transglycosylase-associated protein family)
MDGKAEYNAGIELTRHSQSRQRKNRSGAVKDLPGVPKMFELAWTLLIGAVAGGIARYALPGRNPGGLVVSVMVGLAGAFLAAYLGDRFGWYRQGEADGIIMGAVGAIVTLAVFRFLSGTTAGSGGRENYDL